MSGAAVAQNYTPRFKQLAGTVSKAFSLQTATFDLADIYLTISDRLQWMRSSCPSIRNAQEGSRRIFAPSVPSFSSMHS